MTPERWGRIRAIYETSLDLAPDARSAFVAEQAAGDGMLRDEVLHMLAAAEEDERLVAPESIDLSAMFSDAPPLDAVSLDNDRYVLGRTIGEGGMGIVFEATRADGAFEQRVAIKVLKRGMDTDDIVRRFRQERQVLADLDHASITRLIDGGTTTDGRPFFVMEYIDGLRIDTYADAKDLDVHARVRLFVEVCAGVAYAHQNLVVHRDLKPSNILVEAGGTPRLLDFGVAKLMQPDQRLAVTSVGLRIHTPRYASPEQVRGDPVSTATDVYSLGVVLYELLTGRSPYGLEATTAQTIEQAICETEPARPSMVVGGTPRIAQDHGRRRRRAIRGDLDLIVVKALRKDPARRYASVEGLADDLKRWQRGDPIEARPDSWSYRTRRFASKYRVPVAATAVVVATLVAGLVIATVARAGAERRERAAEWRSYVSLIAAADAVTRPDITSQRPREAGLLLDQCPEPYRAWEWNYLQQRRDQSMLRIETKYRPWSIAFSPDGRTIASGAGESSGQLHLWKPDTGARELSFRGTTPEQPPRIMQIEWSPAGTHLVGISEDGTTKLWDPDLDTLLSALPVRTDRITAAVHSPDGSRLITRGETGVLTAWSVTDPMAPRAIWTRGSLPSSSNLAVTPDGSILVPDAEGNIMVHGAAGGARIGVIAAEDTPVRTVRAAGRRIVSLHADGTVVISSAETFAPVARTRPPAPFRLERAQAISPSGALAAGTADNTLLVWRTHDGVVVARLHGVREADDITDLAFSPDERRVVAASRELRELIVWSLPPTRPSWQLDGHAVADGPDFNQVAFSADGTLLAAARRGSIEIYDVATGLRVQRIALGSNWVSTVAFLAPSTGQIVAGHGTLVQWWDVRTAELMREVDGRTSRRVAIDRTRRRLAWGSGNRIRIADAESGRLIREFAGALLPVESVAFSPDGDRIVAGTGVTDPQEECDARAIVWDVHSGRQLHAYAGFTRKLQAVAVGDDGSVVAGGFRGWIAAWRPGDDQPARWRSRGTEWRVWSLAVSPDGRRLVGGCPDSAVRILNMASGEEVLALPWMPNAKDVTFSDDGRRLAAASYNGSALIQIWDVAPTIERVAPVSVRGWYDALGGDWPAIRVAVCDDPFLTVDQREEAIAHVDRLAPWFLPRSAGRIPESTRPGQSVAAGGRTPSESIGVVSGDGFHERVDAVRSR